MKVYYDRATTPLGFHYFINYFWLPLFVIRNLGTLFFSEIQFSYYAIATSLVTVVLAIIAFFGFIDWSSIGWRFFRLLVFAIVFGNLLGMILSIVYSDDYTVVSYYFIYMILYAIAGIPVLIYYKHRKPLFYHDMKPKMAEEYAVSHNDPYITQSICTNYDAIPQVKFCRHCGVELAPDAIFCPKCGTKVVEVPQEAE